MFVDTLELFKKIWNLLPTFFSEVYKVLLTEFSVGDISFTLVEFLFGAGISIIFIAKIAKFLL